MIKKLFKKLILGHKADSESFVAYLRDRGISVGKNVSFYSPTNTVVDVQNPWLLTIGDNVNIAYGVLILTHDYSWSVLKRHPDYKGRVIGAQGPVTIGNNVFIGMNAVITRNVTIGDNVVIGAGSIVTKDCESNSVYAGSPAKKIMTIEEYASKRIDAQFEEARRIALIYREKTGKNPPIEVFSEYFMLFCSATQASEIPVFRSQMATCGNFDESAAYMTQNKPMFESYEDFLDACFK